MRGLLERATILGPENSRATPEIGKPGLDFRMVAGVALTDHRNGVRNGVPNSDRCSTTPQPSSTLKLICSLFYLPLACMPLFEELFACTPRSSQTIYSSCTHAHAR